MEEFRDGRWGALNEHPWMREYWDKMKRSGIGQAEAEDFLNRVWAICAAVQDMDFLRSARRDEVKEAEENETLRRHIPNWEPSQNKVLLGGKTFFIPTEPDELVMAATASRKKNDALDCARYLVGEAKKRFGKSLYTPIAVAVSVALGMETGLSSKQLSQSFYDLKKNQ